MRRTGGFSLDPLFHGGLGASQDGGRSRLVEATLPTVLADLSGHILDDNDACVPLERDGGIVLPELELER